jgi:hypothetical protein
VIVSQLLAACEWAVAVPREATWALFCINKDLFIKSTQEADSSIMDFWWASPRTNKFYCSLFKFYFILIIIIYVFYYKFCVFNS